MQLDDIDKRIIREIQYDGRLSNAELSGRVGLSPTPCLRRLHRLEKLGVIEGYSARINRKSVGLEVMCFVAVQVAQHIEGAIDTFQQEVNKLDCVISCHLVTGENDFILQVVAEDLDSFRDIVMHELFRLPGVKRLQTNLSLGLVKDQGLLPLDGPQQARRAS